MTKLTLASALALTMALAACGQSPAPAEKADKAAAPKIVSDAFRQQLLALSTSQRNAVFFKAIAANGGACPEVQRAVFQQDYTDQMMWVADCAITGDWAVFISESGYAQVRECRLMPKELPACKPLPPQ